MGAANSTVATHAPHASPDASPDGVFMPRGARPAEEFLWNATMPGSPEQVLGPQGRWWRLEWRKGDRLATLKIGLLTNHEARSTPGIRGDGWHTLHAMGLCVCVSLDF